MSRSDREQSPPMDANEQLGQVRKGRGWASSDLGHESAALRADTPHLPDQRHLRPRSPSPYDASEPSRPDEPFRGDARPPTWKAPRQEGVLPFKATPPCVPAYVPGSSSGILPTPPIAPTQDWACAVCSNWNSSQRSSCFRCSTTYQDSLNTVPTREIAVGPLAGFSPDDVVQALIQQLEAAGMPLALQDCHALATPTGAFTYVQFRDVTTASQAMTLLRCTLRLGETSYTPKFSREAYVHRFAAKADSHTRMNHAAADDDGRSSAESLPLPEHLSQATWEAPSTFDSPEAEKKYLRMMSDHWAGLSAAQKAFYDDRVRLALQSPSKLPSQDVVPAPTEVSVPPQEMMSSDPARAAGAVPATPSSAVLSLKERLAQRRAAKAVTSGTPTATQGAATPSPVSTTQASAGAEGGTSTSTVTLLSGTSDEADGEPEEVLAFFDGMPVPPVFCRADGVHLPTKLALTGVPLAIAERLVSPRLLPFGML